VALSAKEETKTVIRPTPHIEAMPATTPFVGPEALARRIGISDLSLLRLGANESTFGASPHVAEALASEIPRISLYGDPEVYLLREALASSLGCSKDELVVASGIDDLLGLFIRAYVGEGGLAVATSGTYPTFFYHIAGYGARCETVEYDGTRPNLDTLAERAIARKPALVYLANPDNPGGGFHGREALARFLDAVPQQTLILLDEAYAEYAPTNELLPIRDQPNLVRLRTFSKAYGLAGMRVGYALADATVIATLEKIRQHFGVTRLSSLAALTALQDRAFVDHVVLETIRGREEYYTLATELGLTSYPSSTNFVLFECGSVERAVAIVPALLERGVFIRKPGSGRLASCIRVSVGKPEERKEFALHLASVLAQPSLKEAQA